MKDPKSDGQAVGLTVTIVVGLLGLCISIAALILLIFQGNQVLAQGTQALSLSETANAESALSNNYVRLAWCQAADEATRMKVKWCQENPGPWSFNRLMPEEELALGMWPREWEYLDLLSNTERKGLERYLEEQGIDPAATPDAEMALVVVRYLVMSRKAGE